MLVRSVKAPNTALMYVDVILGCYCPCALAVMLRFVMHWVLDWRIDHYTLGSTQSTRQGARQGTRQEAEGAYRMHQNSHRCQVWNG